MMSILNFIVLIVLIINRISADDDEPQTKVPQGKIAGYWKESLNGRKYAAFEGIPYAKPPVRQYRFEPPIPAKGWRGTWQAKLYPSACLQWANIPGDEAKSVIGDEDCLYLNVYSPNLKPDNKLPVLVFIHGGSFLFGTSMYYGATYMMDQDVVYVSINYRLGALGFLSTQDEIVPGNNGLKDQNVALKWVKKNIPCFGGDADQITIMGMSAGGASVHYHILSDKSKGLFQRAISQSGNAFCPWAQQIQAREKAFQLAAYMGCPTNCTLDMVTCLKLRPAAAIVRSVPKIFMVYDHIPHAPFTPVIETVDSRNPFLSKHPYKIIEEGLLSDVPWMTSITTSEGLYPVAVFMSHPEFLDIVDSKWDEFAPHLYEYYFSVPKDMHGEIAGKIKEKYLEGQGVSRDNLDKYVESVSDRHFKVPMEKAVKLQSAKIKEPIYIYEFGYAGQTSLAQKMSNSSDLAGVCHGDDTGYCFETYYMDPASNEDDKKMIDFKTKLIASFVSTGKPEVGGTEWEPVKSEEEEFNYLKILAPDEVKMDKAKHFGDTEFWDSLEIMENEALYKIGRDEL